jgi:hypothetical protein
MSKLMKVILEFDDKTMTIEGDEAIKWNNHNMSITMLAYTHGLNSFDIDPIEWKIEERQKEVM